MGDFLPLMENASALDWITVGVLAWLVWRERQMRARLDKHEDMCIEFRRQMYERTGKHRDRLTRVETMLDERTQRSD